MVFDSCTDSGMNWGHDTWKPAYQKMRRHDVHVRLRVGVVHHSVGKYLQATQTSTLYEQRCTGNIAAEHTMASLALSDATMSMHSRTATEATLVLKGIWWVVDWWVPFTIMARSRFRSVYLQQLDAPSMTRASRGGGIKVPT